MSATRFLEPLLLASAGISIIADVSSAAGGAYNVPIALYGLYAVHARNGRAVLFHQALMVFSILMDIIFLGVWGRSRTGAAVAFVAINLVVKCAAALFTHKYLFEVGGSYSWSTPVPSGDSATGGATGDGSAGVGPFEKDVVATIPLDAPSSIETSAYGYQEPASDSVYKSYQQA